MLSSALFNTNFVNPKDFILGGDFNAGCSYVGSGDWDRIRLRTEDRFEWVIGDDANTNVAQGSQCPYDR